MTWTGDDHQLVAVQDGVGWLKKPTAFFNSSLWTISGSPRDAVFEAVSSYPELNYAKQPEDAPNYYAFGTLSVRGRIYQFLSTLDTNDLRHWIGAKLIYSPDNGRTWCNQDGSSPVVWEPRGDQSRERLVFFNEPQESFSLLSILQMGRDYGGNRDGYIYVYAPNGNIDGTMNSLVMFRVRIPDILHRDAYEYFGGLTQHGTAVWVSDIERRAVVHHFPNGWVNTRGLFADLVVESWVPSVVYNEPLGLYLMAACGIGCAPDGNAFGKPSYLGIWVASAPWGPWEQIHEEKAWTPGSDPEARAYDVQISPKWITGDGTSFWLVWADIRGIQKFALEARRLKKRIRGMDSDKKRSAAIFQLHQKYLPRYTFNTQRFDIVLV